MAMMFKRLGLINRNQMGFTLIELMLAIAITSVITGAITTTIFQVVNSSARTNNHMMAVRQTQNAGYWVSRDAQMAQVVQPAGELVDDPDGTRFPLTLTWTEWDGTVNEITYILEGTDLWRDYDGQRDPVAQFIDSTMKDGQTQTRCEFTDGALTFTVTATVGNDSQAQSETRIYEVRPRPGS
jgi:prepilin-type N-terminal cleavage/methylation domain-containing protein